MSNEPRNPSEVRQTLLLKELTCEEDCTGSFACLHFASCGFKCAGLCSRGPTGTHRGAASSATGAWLCVDRWISPLGWGALRVGSGSLGSSASSACGLGCSSLGSSAWRVGADRRALAVNAALDHEERGFGLALFFVLSIPSNSKLRRRVSPRRERARVPWAVQSTRDSQRWIPRAIWAGLPPGCVREVSRCREPDRRRR